MTTAETRVWEVYPSCDVALGEAFRNRPGLENSYIGVNIESIHEAINQLGGGAPGLNKMHFLIKRAEFDGKMNDDDTMQIMQEGRLILYDKEEVEIPPKDPHTTIDLLECQVDIGINHINYIQDSLKAKAKDLGYEESQMMSYADNGLQYVATHEIKHAIDLSQDEMRIANANYRQRLITKICLVTSAASYGGFLAANAVISKLYGHYFNGSPQIPTVIAMGATVLAAFATIKRVGLPYFNNAFSYKSPAEVAAYDNSIRELSTQLPDMITIVA